jgi:hypothetical protein
MEYSSMLIDISCMSDADFNGLLRGIKKEVKIRQARLDAIALEEKMAGLNMLTREKSPAKVAAGLKAWETNKRNKVSLLLLALFFR